MRPEDTQTVFEPVHDDRRRMPRVHLRTPGRVTTPAGEKVSMTVRDMSPDGLQLRCSKAVAARAHPSGRVAAAGETTAHFEVTFAAPTEDGPAVITLLTRLVYFELVAPDVVALGVLTTGASPQDRKRLARAFYSAMRPADEGT